MKRAQDHVPIETVLCDREFDSQRVFQTLSNLGVNYLSPKRINSAEREVIGTMDEDEEEIAVESAPVHVVAGNHQIRFVSNVDRPMDYAPVLTAGGCVEIVVSALIPPD